MKVNNKITDDYCDIYENKICDNCGRCLEKDGIDVRAINIEDIAKTVEENEYLENEYKTSLESNDNLVGKDDTMAFDYSNFEEILDGVDEYKDAFDNIEYIEDLELFDDSNLEEMTVEVYPGIRKVK